MSYAFDLLVREPGKAQQGVTTPNVKNRTLGGGHLKKGKFMYAKRAGSRQQPFSIKRQA